MTTPINDQHLGFLQTAIARMASNSFLVKGWSMTLVSALLGLAVDAGGAGPSAVALLPALAFWGLDGYFLGQERLFRDLYQRVIERDAGVPDFSMRTAPLTLARWWRACTSVTLLAFHGAVLSAALLFIRSGAQV